MRSPSRRIPLFVLAAVLFLLAAMPAAAAEFPSRPVTLINPWPPGGAIDMLFRVLAETTKKHLGQPVIIDNKAGGGGTVGPATMAATAKPDGYTIAQIPMPILRYPLMMKVTWDPMKDFSYILEVSGYTFGVVVKADAPWKTFKEFIAHAKANPGKVSYGTPGAGTTQHLTMERIANAEGIKWIHVPSKGTGENLPAILGGHVTAGADSTGWAPMVDAGQLRLLCLWGEKRSKRWPAVPTLKELGYGIVSTSPWGLAGPKGMDPKGVKVLHDAFKKGMEDPEALKMMDKLDIEPSYRNTADYAKHVKELYEEEKAIIEKLGWNKK